MTETGANTVRRRLRSAYVTSLISISLVLFVAGILGVILFFATSVSNYLRENISITLVLKDNSKEVDVRLLQKTLDASEYVRSTHYISKAEAAEQLKEELGEDFLNMLGFNPLNASLEIYLHAPWAQNDSIQKIKNQLLRNPIIQEVYYRESLVEIINRNIQKITIVLLIFIGLLLVIALALINNTVRLAVYSRRFIIRTMQLVGAARAFIRRPLILRFVLVGLVGGLMADGMLVAMLYYLYRMFGELSMINDPVRIGILMGSIVFIGIFVNWISAYFALNRYLSMDEDQMY